MASLPTVFEVTVAFDVDDGQEIVAMFSNVTFKKLMQLSKIDPQKDVNKSDVGDVFLDWDDKIRMIVEGVVKDVYTNEKGGGG